MLTPSLQEKYLLDHLPNGVYYVDGADDRYVITYWNKAAEDALGYTAEEALGMPCRALMGESRLASGYLCNALCPLSRLNEDWKDKKFVPVVTQLLHKNGHKLPIQIRCFPLLSEEGSLAGAAVFLEPLIPHEDMARCFMELEHIAYQDALTELPNRRYLDEKLKEWMSDWYQKNGVLLF